MHRLSRTVLLSLVSLLVVAGLLMLYSTTYTTDKYVSGIIPQKFFMQSIWIAITGAAIITIWKTDYHFFCKYALLFLGLTGCALGYLAFVHTLSKLHAPAGLVNAFPFTGGIKGAYRWLTLGPIRIQPSEFVKVCLILFLAHYFSRNTRYLAEAKRGVFIPLGVGLAVVAIVAGGGSVSVATITLGVLLTMAFVAGVPMRWLSPAAFGLLAAIVLVPILVFSASLPQHSDRTAAESSPNIVAGTLTKVAGVLGKNRQARVETWLDPESQAKTRELDAGKREGGGGYQLWMSMLALGSGGWDGLGFTESRMKKFYLPEAHTDFIVAVIGEELGFLAVLILITAYALLVGVCFWMATQAVDKEGVLICVGMGASFGLHAFFNIAVVSGFIPTTGITAPFVSYGGSNVLASGIGIGLLLSISRHSERVALERAAQAQAGAAIPPPAAQRLFSDTP
jgi:cell division protein FtsW